MRNHEAPSIDTKTKSRRALAVSRAASAVAVVAALTAGACSADHSTATPNTQKPSTTTTIELPATSTTRVAETLPKQEYFGSQERNQAIYGSVQDAGFRIIRAAQDGQLGYFDFYNAETDEWQSKSPKTEGWGWLQHHPDFGGSASQLSIFIYRTADGGYDFDKGVRGLHLSIGENQSVSFENGRLSQISGPDALYNPEWDVTIAGFGQGATLSDTITASQAKSEQEILFIDVAATQAVENKLTELGLPPEVTLKTPN